MWNVDFEDFPQLFIRNMHNLSLQKAKAKCQRGSQSHFNLKKKFQQVAAADLEDTKSQAELVSV